MAEKQHTGMQLKRKLIDELRAVGTPEKTSFWKLKNATLILMLNDKKPDFDVFAGTSKKDRRRIRKKARRDSYFPDMSPAPIPTKKPLRSNFGFYDTDEWKSLRYKALVKYGATCQCCGATRADGVKIHVDHIKPRSKYPSLELCFDNLQVLCEPCNMGKRASDQTDWRDQAGNH